MDKQFMVFEVAEGAVCAVLWEGKSTEESDVNKAMSTWESRPDKWSFEKAVSMPQAKKKFYEKNNLKDKWSLRSSTQGTRVEADETLVPSKLDLP